MPHVPDHFDDERGDDRYAERAEAMDERYLAAWRKLSPAKRLQLSLHGITGPELNTFDSKQGTRDVSDFIELKAPLPSISQQQRAEDEIVERFGIAPAKVRKLISWIMGEIEGEAERRKSEHLARVIGFLLVENNTKVSVMGLAFALDFKELGRLGYGTMRLAAPLVRCSPAYLSQCANKWADLLEIPRPKTMKTAEARESYRAARKANHWRKQKCPQKPKNKPSL